MNIHVETQLQGPLWCHEIESYSSQQLCNSDQLFSVNYMQRCNIYLTKNYQLNSFDDRRESDVDTANEKMGNCLNAEFIADASIPDGTVIKAGQKVRHRRLLFSLCTSRIKFTFWALDFTYSVK